VLEQENPTGHAVHPVLPANEYVPAKHAVPGAVVDGHDQPAAQVVHPVCHHQKQRTTTPEITKTKTKTLKTKTLKTQPHPQQSCQTWFPIEYVPATHATRVSFTALAHRYPAGQS
jgi:hypothetical protein